MFDITLYTNTSPNNYIDKNLSLSTNGTLTGKLTDQCSIQSPVILVELNESISANYVHIPIFGRYYYITDVTIVKNNLYKLTLKVDVLMSFKTTIRHAQGIIDRCEDAYTDNASHTGKYIPDNKHVLSSKYNTTIKGFTGSNNNFTHNGRYIIVTAG